jgi:type III pantothenate kinase
MRADTILLMDAGNSRIKWGVERAGEIGFGESIASQAPLSDTVLDSHWGGLERPVTVALASVAAKQVDDAIIAWVSNRWQLDVRKICACRQMAGVVNGYENPSALGVDRWLGLLAAHSLAPAGPVCVADCGTAITMDLLDAGGNHRGGVIAPGLTMMQTALVQGTDRLTTVSPGGHQGLGINTAGAIAAGVTGAAVGLIEHFMHKYGRDGTLLLTGGDASAIAAELSFPYRLEPHLVLMGLSIAVSSES